MMIEMIILINLKWKQSKFLEHEKITQSISSTYNRRHNTTQKYLDWSVSSR